MGPVSTHLMLINSTEGDLFPSSKSSNLLVGVMVGFEPTYDELLKFTPHSKAMSLSPTEVGIAQPTSRCLLEARVVCNVNIAG